MTLREIAYRNLIRRKGKTAFILAGLAIGVCTVVAIVSFVDTMTSDINNKIEKYGANILIVPKTENLALTYGGISLGGVSFEMEEIREADLEKIKTIKNAANVAAVGPMVLGVIHVADNKVLLAGIDFQATKILKPWWKGEGALPKEGEVLLGAEAARVMSLGTGDFVEVKGQRLQVAGTLNATGSQDDHLVFTRIATAQSILGKAGKISMAEVAALCAACPIEEMVRQISGVLPGAKVMAIQQVVKGRMETLSQFKKFSYGISLVVILIGSLVVLVTMMGSVRERTREIGIFRAIGFRRSHIMQIVFTEAAIISTVAGVLGYLSGMAATNIAVRFFTESTITFVPFNFELAAGAVALAVVVGLGASIYPALLAARLDPNEAIRAL